MGVSDFLFGGPQYNYKPVGGLDPNMGPGLLGNVQNFSPDMYGSVFGQGRFLKGAKQDYNDMRSGKDISNIAGFNGQLGAINAAYASGDKARNRQAGMNLALMNQPQLAAAQQGDLQNQSNQDRGNTIAGAAGNFYNQTQNFGQNAMENMWQRRLQGAQMKLGANENALQQYLGSFRAPTGQSQGFLGALGSVAGAVAPFI